jgi:tetraprenyl-beta-curcumene synthase
MVGRNRQQLALANAFAGTAGRYWLGVFPHVGRELDHWRSCADRIPDPGLRRLALSTQRSERGNLEGAAAFAVLAPRAQRARVVRATVAFQTAYDFLDTLAEQPGRDPLANARQLHLALLRALEPSAEHPDYYAHNRGDQDNGYIRALIETCRSACRSLPSYGSVADAACRAASRMVSYQSLTHGAPGQTQRALARWARELTPAGSGLQWWETAAGSASSLSVLALIAAAGQPLLSAEQATATDSAYFPWIGALHVLLDSLIDRPADIASGHHSLVAHYSSSEEAASRVGAIAIRAMQATETVPEGTRHAMILAAMASFYLSAPCAGAPAATTVARDVLDAMGGLATPTMAVLRTRRVAARLLGGAGPAADPIGGARPPTRNSSIGLSTCRDERRSTSWELGLSTGSPWRAVTSRSR